MFTTQEYQLVLEILNKRRAWLINQVKHPEAEYNQIEQYKVTSQVLGSAIGKLQALNPNDGGENGAEKEVDLSHFKVLIVEDDKFSANLMQEILAEIKIDKIEFAVDGNEALTKLFQSEEAFDLVLCDWNMPGKSGLEVHTTLRSDNRFKDLIFILVSAVADADQIRVAITQGVKDYVVKPIDEKILKRKILTAYKRRSEES